MKDEGKKVGPLDGVVEIQFVDDISFPGDGFGVNKGHLIKTQLYPEDVQWEALELGILISCKKKKDSDERFRVLVFWSNIAALYYSPSGSA